MNIKPIISIFAAIFIIGGTIVFVTISPSLKEEEKKDPVIEAKRYVKTASVNYRDVPTQIYAYGRVQSAQTLDLISEVSGRMFQGKLQLKAGQRFKKGTLIYYIDDTQAKLNLQAQKSNFMRDLASILPDLKIDHGSSFSKWESYFESLEVDTDFPKIPENNTKKEKTFLATKNIYANYYSIKSSEYDLRKYRYYAPFDGSILEVNIQTGSFVNGSSNIAKILRSGALELKVSVETEEVPWIITGTETKVNSKEQGREWLGVVTRIGDVVNQSTQSVDVFINIYPSKDKLYDGQYLEASIPGETITNGMIIPRGAIYNDNEVYVLQDSLLKKHEINVLRINEETVVFDGLPENADLIIEPVVGAHNNMKALKLSSDINEQEKEINTSSANVSSN